MASRTDTLYLPPPSFRHAQCYCRPMTVYKIDTPANEAPRGHLAVTAILFMVPFGISMAETVRVGHAVGRGDPEGVRRAGWTAMLIGIALAIVCTFVVIL